MFLRPGLHEKIKDCALRSPRHARASRGTLRAAARHTDASSGLALSLRRPVSLQGCREQRTVGCPRPGQDARIEGSRPLALGCEGPNQMKAFLRCGMGPCQGRLFGLTVTELIAQERGTAPEQVGYYRLRPPVKPITLGELASIPISEAERKAVER